jgi:hypothetical protein
MAISGVIGKEEIQRLAVVFANTGAVHNKGRKHTREQNLQHSIFMKGRKQSSQEKENQIKAQTGVACSEKRKQAISNALMGNKNGVGSKANLDRRRSE